ncbi:hypothetical protein AXX12_08005 [Anaerosporomusa subterranea]|uniref:Outer membrane chaperone Skp n=1 Tax=Anaerosporomusa subterranea TaxID=1794912 RepID=A0A154BR52_ANASB|nr:hypothetical protein [Anaerosporomusa subterranea]KYZ76369.1 hypothetical protein AXX12_08005 [Anaerosporomusa subterranea]
MNRVTTRHKMLAIAAMLLVWLTAGCAKKTEVVQPKPEMGILNMTKAVKAHPRYTEVEKLQGERATLLAQLSRQESETIAASQQAGIDMTNLSKATDQEFQTKMASKHDEINRQLQAQSETLRRQINEQVDKYVRELDESYQNRTFGLQVKLKTIDLSKEEQAAIQKQLDEIQNERMGKIVARQQELTAGMNDSMKQAEQAAAKDLDVYGQQLKSNLSAELAQKAQAMQTLPGGGLSMPAADNIQGKLAANQRDLAKLQQEIITDIKQRAATIATQYGLTTVLADVEIFTSATRDITTDVIAGSK